MSLKIKELSAFHEKLIMEIVSFLTQHKMDGGHIDALHALVAREITMIGTPRLMYRGSTLQCHFDTPEEFDDITTKLIGSTSSPVVMARLKWAKYLLGAMEPTLKRFCEVSGFNSSLKVPPEFLVGMLDGLPDGPLRLEAIEMLRAAAEGLPDDDVKGRAEINGELFHLTGNPVFCLIAQVLTKSYDASTFDEISFLARVAISTDSLGIAKQCLDALLKIDDGDEFVHILNTVAVPMIGIICVNEAKSSYLEDFLWQIHQRFNTIPLQSRLTEELLLYGWEECLSALVCPWDRAMIVFTKVNMLMLADASGCTGLTESVPELLLQGFKELISSGVDPRARDVEALRLTLDERLLSLALVFIRLDMRDDAKRLTISIESESALFRARIALAHCHQEHDLERLRSEIVHMTEEPLRKAYLCMTLFCFVDDLIALNDAIGYIRISGDRPQDAARILRELLFLVSTSRAKLLARHQSRMN